MNFKWMMETTNGLIFHFHTTTHDDGPSPLDSIDDLNQGDFWSIDAGSNTALFSAFEKNPLKSSFVLIPKKNLVKIWTVAAKIKSIN
jgi:hypothetical protein